MAAHLPAKIGGISTSERIRKATDDKDVKAIVLRVNSPGGSVLGSELIRDQLQIAKDKGKPVVVSHGQLGCIGWLLDFYGVRCNHCRPRHHFGVNWCVCPCCLLARG